MLEKAQHNAGGACVNEPWAKFGAPALLGDPKHWCQNPFWSNFMSFPRAIPPNTTTGKFESPAFWVQQKPGLNVCAFEQSISVFDFDNHALCEELL